MSEFTVKFDEFQLRFPHVHKYLVDQVGVELWEKHILKVTSIIS